MTVGLPTYNRAEYLREAIDSVLAQTFRDFTLVISDNASTDDTPELVASYDDPRIVYRRHDVNRGWIPNFNASLEGASTDYAMFLCDDDLLRPGALARAVEVLDGHPDVVLYHSAFDYIDGSGAVRIARMDYAGRIPVDTIETGGEFIKKSITAGCRVCSSTAVFRVAALPSPPYDIRAGFAADYLLWLRLALDSNVYFSAEPEAAYRLHDGTISAGWSDVIQGMYRPRPGAIMHLRRVKLDFLRESADRLPDYGELRRDAERSAVRSFMDEVVRTRIPKPVKRAVKALVPGRTRAAQVP
ncbi:MAG TPA: glycosyltransferase [Acidimicrobiia bacterium]|nr:glycosyltransferase [Acidimicrobiia bacterium]